MFQDEKQCIGAHTEPNLIRTKQPFLKERISKAEMFRFPIFIEIEELVC
jgi:hypothetical protein